MILAPNILLVSGGGRNVGKTSFVCSVIDHFTRQQQAIVGIKISSHFHELPADAPIIFQHDDAIIIKETQRHTRKDSSLFLQSGAEEVLYIQARNDGLQLAVPHILYFVQNRLCVCESGGLRQYIKPGVHVYFALNNIEQKISPPFTPDVIINNFEYSQLELHIQNNCWKLK